MTKLHPYEPTYAVTKSLKAYFVREWVLACGELSYPRLPGETQTVRGFFGGSIPAIRKVRPVSGLAHAEWGW